MPHRKSAEPRSIRAWNEVLVVQALWEVGHPIRISALSELTASTLGQVLRGLEAKGWARSRTARNAAGAARRRCSPSPRPRVASWGSISACTPVES